MKKNKRKMVDKEANRKLVLSFAGAWNDFPEQDFQDYLLHTKQTGKQLFKDIEF